MWANGVAQSAHPPAPTAGFQEAIVGQQEIGYAEAERVAGFQLISPDAIKSLFTTVLNYAMSKGGDGVSFDVGYADVSQGRIALLFGANAE